MLGSTTSAWVSFTAGGNTDRTDGVVPGIAHHNQTETYIIVSGTGTLVTGGTMIDPKEISKDSTAYKVLNGPSVNTTVKDGYARVVKPGDIIIIPPDVFHGWVEVRTTSTICDPPRSGPRSSGGYVNPAIQK